MPTGLLKPSFPHASHLTPPRRSRELGGLGEQGLARSTYEGFRVFARFCSCGGIVGRCVDVTEFVGLNVAGCKFSYQVCGGFFEDCKVLCSVYSGFVCLK